MGVFWCCLFCVGGIFVFFLIMVGINGISWWFEVSDDVFVLDGEIEVILILWGRYL